MTTGLSDTDRAMCDAVAAYATDRLAPAAQEIDEREEFIARHLAGLSELGIMGMNLPEQWGGPGMSAPALLRAVESIAGACAATASAVTAHFLASDSILIGGDDDIRQRYLPDAATGRNLGAFALTEPGAGSNPADMRTRATRSENGYHIAGTKHFISNGAVADFIVVFAVTDADAGHRGISAFIVDRGSPGLTYGPAEPTMGVRGGHIFELSFDCIVPIENLVGTEGSGFGTAMRVLDNGRVEVAGMCLGITQAAIDATLSWVEERKVGGMQLAEYQGVQWMLADMATQCDAARLLAENAASLRQQGARFSKEASMAKLFASEMAAKVTDLALQLHGGYGFSRALPLERYVRDVRIMRIFEGASEVQRNIIARQILG
ncbi:MAG: acyl-CoA dehydrogenase [Alphaproteobacteria bacterium]|nr:acyl-CoA dehydrogenase [Alphaproteobacteria bacterium]